MGVFTGEVFSCEDTFFLSLVGQHGSADHITNSKNAWDVGLQVIIHYDSPPLVHLDACTIKAQFVSVWLATSGD